MTDNPFSVEMGDLNIDPETDFVMRLPSGLAGKDELLEAFRRGLHLPDYFGCNWDALSECLRDLSWIRQRRVILIHGDLPQLDLTELETYLEVLAECVRDWKPGENHQLIVCFSQELQKAITDILAHQRGQLRIDQPLAGELEDNKRDDC